jgi:hypothetical protein
MRISGTKQIHSFVLKYGITYQRFAEKGCLQSVVEALMTGDGTAALIK